MLNISVTLVIPISVLGRIEQRAIQDKVSVSWAATELILRGLGICTEDIATTMKLSNKRKRPPKATDSVLAEASKSVQTSIDLTTYWPASIDEFRKDPVRSELAYITLVAAGLWNTPLDPTKPCLTIKEAGTRDKMNMTPITPEEKAELWDLKARFATKAIA